MASFPMFVGNKEGTRNLHFDITDFFIFFTHCNVHDPECNIHDSVLSSSKEGTHHKRNIYHFVIVVSLFTEKAISFVFRYACRIHRNLHLRTWFLCNIHESSIYLNVNFCIIVNLMSFSLNKQLAPTCHKQSER